MLSREQFLAKKGRRFETVKLPSGGEMRIQSLNDFERSAYETSFTFSKDGKKGDFDAARRRLLVRCLVDSEGLRLFADHEEDLLAELDGRDTGVLYEAARVHIGFDKGEIEELVKNSEEPLG